MSRSSDQAMWDEWFPDGAMVTLVRDVPEGWEENDSSPVPRVLVVEFEGKVLVHLPLDVKVTSIEVVSIEDYEPKPGISDKLVLDSLGQLWRFNSNLGPVLTERLKRQRVEQFPMWDPEKEEEAAPLGS